MTGQRGSQTRTEIAAVHEAGHAVVAAWEGRKVGRVIVRRDRPGSGVVYHSRGCLRNPYDPTAGPGSARAAWEYTRARILSDVRIKLAGPVAEAKALKQPLRAIGAYGDLTGCERLADQLEEHWQTLLPFSSLPPLNAPELINAQRAYMRRWVARPPVWDCIKRLADDLSRRGELQGSDVCQILGRLKTPPAQLALPATGLDVPQDELSAGVL